MSYIVLLLRHSEPDLETYELLRQRTRDANMKGPTELIAADGGI